MNKLNIKSKLTLWNAIVITAIYIIVSFVILQYTESEFRKLTDAKLEIGFKTLEDVLIISGGDIYDVYHLGHANPFIVWKDKRSLYITNSWRDQGFTTNCDSLPVFHIFNHEGGQKKYKIKWGEVEQYDFKFAYAADISDLSKQVKGLRLILVAGLPLVLLLALGGGLFLAERALRPVRDIIKVANKITSDDLTRRLPQKNPDDEIGQLVTVINETLARLEKSFDQMKRFTSDASHELRTPLTVIRSITEVALNGQLDKDVAREKLGSILEEIDYLSNLVEKLLILSRGDAGKISLLPQEMNLEEFITETVHELEVLADEKNLTLTFVPTSNNKVKLDRDTFKLAVSNVLYNAIKYTPENGKIEIRTDKSDNKISIIISDNGPGIPEDQLDKVFDRFYRVDQARDAANKGTGLGLSIAQMAAKLNGGSIKLENKQDGGTKCIIVLDL